MRRKATFGGFSSKFNYDNALINALEHEFPRSRHQLCVFHMNMNVVLHIKKWRRRAAQEEEEDEDEAGGTPEEGTDDVRKEDADKARLNGPARNQATMPSRVPKLKDIPYTRQALFDLLRFMEYSIHREVYETAWQRLQEKFGDHYLIHFDLDVDLTKHLTDSKTENSTCCKWCKKSFYPNATRKRDHLDKSCSSFATTHGKGRQASLPPQFFKPKKSLRPTETLQKAFAKACSTGGRPFTMYEDNVMCSAFHLFDSTFTPPNRKQVCWLA
jgi:hypothetical protein